MKLATIREPDGAERVAVVHVGRGIALLREVIKGATGTIPDLLADGCLSGLAEAVAEAPDTVFRPDAHFVAPYRRPRKIWGIGLNYVEHAADLSETVPGEPASFLKADHTIIGPDDPIPVPYQSERTTAEAELGLVIGRECHGVPEDRALDYVTGVCPVLDQTAEDILERNPRFLTRSKNFPGFFSFGPTITLFGDRLRREDIGQLQVSTVLNGQVARTNSVANMRFSPAFLVSFHSQMMPLYPGDIISTGTPGAVQIRPGDRAECRITGLDVLCNPVVAGVAPAR